MGDYAIWDPAWHSCRLFFCTRIIVLGLFCIKDWFVCKQPHPANKMKRVFLVSDLSQRRLKSCLEIWQTLEFINLALLVCGVCRCWEAEIALLWNSWVLFNSIKPALSPSKSIAWHLHCIIFEKFLYLCIKCRLFLLLMYNLISETRKHEHLGFCSYHQWTICLWANLGNTTETQFLHTDVLNSKSWSSCSWGQGFFFHFCGVATLDICSRVVLFKSWTIFLHLS